MLGEVRIENVDKLSRRGKLLLPSGRILEFPTLWFSVWINDEFRKRYRFFIKNDFREAIFINAYHILTRAHIRKTIEKDTIHKCLHFYGPIMADSGGFIFRDKTNLEIDPLTLLKFYETSKVDIGLTLDHPPDPKNLDDEIIRMKTTLKNALLMFRSKKCSDFLLFPVVHGFSVERLRKMVSYFKRIKPLIGVCVGGMVPLIRTQVTNGRKILVDLLIVIRRLLPDSFIHVLGVGGTTTMHLMFYLGADSVDSCAWEKKAAYGLIQLPKVGDRFIIRKDQRKRYPTLSSKEYKILLECECPACKKHTPEELDASRELRVIHNAWVFQNEVKEAREMIKEGSYEKFVEERMKHSNMFSVFKYARDRLRKEGLKIKS
jgi:tRNA-guanine family transglycosylase